MSLRNYKTTKVSNWNFQNRVFDFWIRTRIECPVISDLAIHKLLAFCTTYLCEEAFSKLVIFQSNNQFFLKNVEYVLCSPLSCINLRMYDLCQNHQVHPGADPGGGDWGDRPSKAYESNFIHHDFVQLGKQHSRHYAILPSVVLSKQCCEVYFISRTVVSR